MIKVIAVLAGGAVGTGFRYLIATLIYSRAGQPGFPYATFLVNVTGSFIIGLLVELFDTRVPVSPTLRVALLTGVLGGYTTFSSFSLETFALLRNGEAWPAALNVVGSVALGLAAVWLGMRLAQSF